MIKSSTDKNKSSGIVKSSTDKSKDTISTSTSTKDSGYEVSGNTFEEKKNSVIEQANESYAEKRRRELKESSDRFKQIREERIQTGRKLDEDEQDALKLIQDIKKKNYKSLSDEDLSPGSMLLMQNYDAKDKSLPYDKTPLVIVIGSRHDSGYVLGLNVHWLPKVMRNTLWSGILKLYRNDIRKGKKPNIDYRQIKSFLFNIGAQFAIRLYIKGRIAKKGIIIDPENMKQAISLPTESITGGKSAEQMYKQAIQAARTAKKVKKSKLRG